MKAMKYIQGAHKVQAVQEQRPQESQQQEPQQPESNAPATSESGALFMDVPRNFHQIVELGRREKWLIEESELDMGDQNVLGSGAFGIVMSASLHGTPVAVKVPRQANFVGDVRNLSQVGNELRILRHVRHPNIVLFHGAILSFESGEFILVLEMVQAQRLDLYIESFNLPDGINGAGHILERFAVMLGVCRALNYLHSQQPHIVHGDLKSVNIMVESGVMPRPKLLDFGLSRVVTQHAKNLGGTPAWMAPEVMIERLPPRPAADVFSFGRLIYFIATGSLPLLHATRQVLQRLAKAKQQIPLTWPPDLPLADQSQALVEACLQLKPQDRPSMAAVSAEFAVWPEDARWGAEDSAALRAAVGLPRPNAAATAPASWQERVRRVRGSAAGARGAGAQPAAPAADCRPPSDATPRSLAPHVPRSLSAVPEGSEAALGSASSLPAQMGDQVLAVSGRKPTPKPTQSLLLMGALLQINFPMPRASCCKYHAAIKHVVNLARDMGSRPCNPDFMKNDFWTLQCSRCGALEVQSGESSLAEFQCDVCGQIHSPGAPDSGSRSVVPL